MSIASMPEGYNLQRYDDCGVADRMPHRRGNARHTFAAESVDADLRGRTVTYGEPNFDMVYEDLEEGIPYVAAVTYASEGGNKRVQTLAAGAVELHGPLVLPDGKAERFLFETPPRAIANGELVLHFVCNEGHNAVASVVELWAPLPSPPVTRLSLVPRLNGVLQGSVGDLAYEAVAHAEVAIRMSGARETFAVLHTGKDGAFQVDLSPWVKPGSSGTIEVVAKHDGEEATGQVLFSDLYFVSPRIRPMAHEVAGLQQAAITLDGTWRLNPSPNDGFQNDGAEGPGWGDFVVPGQWLQQGFTIAPDQSVGVMAGFEVPAQWAGTRIFLRFDAIHGGADYWLNGHYVGHSENLFTPVEFDVTRLTLAGKKNQLALAMKLDTTSETASWSSQYAFHDLGGIDRSVRLFALPEVHVSSLHHDTVLDDACRDATLVLRAHVTNTTDVTVEEVMLRVALSDRNGNIVPLRQSEFALDSLAPGEAAVTRRLVVQEPMKWSAEKPHVYRLRLQLRHQDKLLEEIERQVGFRKIEVKDSQLWLNGKRIKLAGVNRHEIDPLSGRADTAKHAEIDAKLLRDANFNYIRTSHYPPTREFLDACDRVGLYVECEAPFCWTRGGRGEDDVSLAKHFLAPTAAMLEYHGDHPSVILWSLANESGNGPDGEDALPANFLATLELCRQTDPSRPVIFSNEWAKDGGAGDLAVVHYPPFPAEEYEHVKDDRRPILINEYFPPQTFVYADELKLNPGLDVVLWSGGQNAPGSIWNQVYASNRIVGGAIWAGIDEEFHFEDGSVRGYGPWGFVDVWRRRKSLHWDAKRIHSPVWIPVRQLAYEPGQNGVEVPVENRYSFTDLAKLDVRWEIGSRSGPCDAALPPQTTGAIRVPVPQGTAEGALLILRFSDADGRSVTAHGVRLGSHTPQALPTPDAGCPQWREDEQEIVIQCKDFQMRVAKDSGRIVKSGVRLRALPSIFMARRESRNPFNPGGLPYAQYPDAGTRTVESITVEEHGNALALIVKERFDNLEGLVELLLDEAGRASASFQYEYSGEPFDLSELGLRFLMDEQCREIAWRRETEWDVYPDDHIGRPEGRAQARMAQKTGEIPCPPYLSKPEWPWRLDENEYGTRDFRATKYNIYEAELVGARGSGLRVACIAAHQARHWRDVVRKLSHRTARRRLTMTDSTTPRC